MQSVEFRDEAASVQKFPVDPCVPCGESQQSQKHWPPRHNQGGQSFESRQPSDDGF